MLLEASWVHLSAPHLALSSGQQSLKKTDESRSEAVKTPFGVISRASLHLSEYNVE